MHFEISRAVRAGKNLTTAQKTSSLFAEEPRIGAKTLRRGLPSVTLSEQEFNGSLLQIKQLFKAGAIEIKAVHNGVSQDLRHVIDAILGSDKQTVQAAIDKALGSALSFARDEVEKLVQKDETPPAPTPVAAEPAPEMMVEMSSEPVPPELLEAPPEPGAPVVEKKSRSKKN